MILWILKLLPWLSRAKPVADFLMGKWKLIGIAIVLAAAAGLWLYIDHLRDELVDSERLRASLSEMVTDCQDANASNIDTIGDLEWSVNNLRLAVSVSEEEARQLAEEAARREAEARARLSETLTELEELRNAEPSCAAIADMDIGAACPAAVERLREQARASAGSQN